tara:strand:+ start:158 stop:661 length:504 start_codon:yes stop_codon:yes gene_type:complete
MTNDNKSDEEIIEEETQSRSEILQRASVRKSRKLGSLNIRPLSMESLSYLFEVENFFVRSAQVEDGRASPRNANSIWSAAEFIYIHSAPADEVAENVWNKAEFKSCVRHLLSSGGPLNDPEMMTTAVPVINDMVSEYFAAQSEMKTKGGQAVPSVGKKSARRGKRLI